MTVQAFIATARFGLGAKAGEIGTAAADPRGWLARQLDGGPAVPAPLASFPSGAERMAQFIEARRRQGDGGAEAVVSEQFRGAYLAEAGARTRVLIDTDQPFRERLVAFWSNHFTVSVRRPPILGLAGAFEREAIRPHVAGSFRAMLGAVVKHPAMLVYLDNAQSIGPNSRFGRRRGRGLNENLAREILELHTLGIDGGYTQADVREFAKILTGWSLGRSDDGDPGAFLFREQMHEPGEKILLGMRYPEGGIAEGETALSALTRHPATAAHIARQFARHFVADAPPPAAVERLARVFRDTEGDLKALALATVDLREAWAPPLSKVKMPNEFVVSALRATGFAGEGVTLVNALRLMGQPPFAAPSPAGWPDVADQWIGPESVLRRAEWAMALARRVAPVKAPGTLLDATIAPVASTETRYAVERAPSAADAIAMLFACPEFQRR